MVHRDGNHTKDDKDATTHSLTTLETGEMPRTSHDHEKTTTIDAVLHKSHRGASASATPRYHHGSILNRPLHGDHGRKKPHRSKREREGPPTLSQSSTDGKSSRAAWPNPHHPIAPFSLSLRASADRIGSHGCYLCEITPAPPCRCSIPGLHCSGKILAIFLTLGMGSCCRCPKVEQAFWDCEGN
jgi:hypothetical protein